MHIPPFIGLLFIFEWLSKWSKIAQCVFSFTACIYVQSPPNKVLQCTEVHRGAFCQFTLRCIYYYGSNKSTGKETGKMHLCVMQYIDRILQKVTLRKLNKMRVGSNTSTTPITTMGCRQCLPLSVVQLKGKHCRKPHCRNGVVGLQTPPALVDLSTKVLFTHHYTW